MNTRQYIIEAGRVPLPEKAIPYIVDYADYYNQTYYYEKLRNQISDFQKEGEWQNWITKGSKISAKALSMFGDLQKKKLHPEVWKYFFNVKHSFFLEPWVKRVLELDEGPDLGSIRRTLDSAKFSEWAKWETSTWKKLSARIQNVNSHSYYRKGDLIFPEFDENGKLLNHEAIASWEKYREDLKNHIDYVLYKWAEAAFASARSGIYKVKRSYPDRRRGLKVLYEKELSKYLDNMVRKRGWSVSPDLLKSLSTINILVEAKDKLSKDGSFSQKLPFRMMVNIRIHDYYYKPKTSYERYPVGDNLESMSDLLPFTNYSYRSAEEQYKDGWWANTDRVEEIVRHEMVHWVERCIDHIKDQVGHRGTSGGLAGTDAHALHPLEQKSRIEDEIGEFKDRHGRYSAPSRNWGYISTSEKKDFITKHIKDSYFFDTLKSKNRRYYKDAGGIMYKELMKWNGEVK